MKVCPSVGDALTLCATVIVPVRSIKMVPSFAVNPWMLPKNASVGMSGGSISLFLPQPQRVVLALLVTVGVIMHQQVTPRYYDKTILTYPLIECRRGYWTLRMW